MTPISRRLPARMATLAAVTVFALPALAHPGHLEPAGFLAGFAHPLGGVDHVLAMLAVGLFAAGLFAAGRGARALWALPLGFMGAMGIGAVAARFGLALPAVEPAIAMTVVAMGLLVASGARVPVAGAAGLVAAFAVFHGHAHGAEAGAADFTAYAAGFLAATGLLHASGIALGHGLAAMDTRRAAVVRVASGVATAVAGVVLLAA